MAVDYGQRPFTWFEKVWPNATEYEKLVFDMTIHHVGHQDAYKIEQEARRKAKDRSDENVLDPSKKGSKKISVRMSPERRRELRLLAREKSRAERRAKKAAGVVNG